MKKIIEMLKIIFVKFSKQKLDKSFYQFVNDIYTLKTLIRYNNKFKINNESVAEHCYFVAIITLKLSEYYKFDIEKALSLALIHDLPEIYSTDATHDVKKNFPEINTALKNAEYFIINKYFKNFKSIFDIENTENVELLIVKLADILSCIQYSSSEIQLGNKGYMQDVYNNSNRRLYELLNKLKFAKK